MKQPRHTTGWLWGGAVVLIALAYGAGLDVPGRALREALLPPLALVLAGAAALRGRAPAAPLAACVAAAAGLSMLGILRAPAPERTMVARDWLVLAAPWLACLAAAAFAEDDRDVDEAIEGGAVIALGAIAGVGLLQAWSGWQGIPQVAAPASIFVNRNVAAQCLVLLLPLVLAVAARRGRPISGYPAALALAAGCTLLVATRARGAWLGAVAGAAVFAVALIREKAGRRFAWKPVVVALGAAALATLIPVQIGTGSMPTVGSTLATLAKPASGSGGVRIALWSNTAAMSASRSWLGHGAGRFPVIYPLYHAASRPTPDFGTQYQPSHAHNDWLEYAVEIGWPAALALLAVMVSAVGIGLAKPGPADDGSNALRRAARSAALAGVLVHGMVSFPLHAPAGAFLAWTLVGRSWASRGRASPAAGGTRRALSAAAFVLAAAMALLGAAELSSRAALGQAVRAVQAGDCDAAREPARKTAGSRLASRLVRGTAAMVVFDCDPDERAALATLERALAVHPHHLNLLLAVGSRRMKAGRLEDAERAYRRAAELVPEQGRPWAGLAMVQALDGDRAAAAASCANALRVEPELEAARRFCEANGLAPSAP